MTGLMRVTENGGVWPQQEGEPTTQVPAAGTVPGAAVWTRA